MPLPPLLSYGTPVLLPDVTDAPVFLPATDFALHSGDAERPTIVHRRAVSYGNVHLDGATLIAAGVCLRGDVAKISIGHMVALEEDVLLRPATRLRGGAMEALPLRIGVCTSLGSRTISEALSIGAFVVVENDCILGNSCVVGNGVWLQNGSVVPPGAALEPFWVYAGSPAQPVARLAEDSHPLHVRERVARAFRSIVIG